MKRLLILSILLAGLVPGLLVTASADTTIYGKVKPTLTYNPPGLPLASPFDYPPISLRMSSNGAGLSMPLSIPKVPQAQGGPASTVKFYNTAADALNGNKPIFTGHEGYNMNGMVSVPESLFASDAVYAQGLIAVWYNNNGQVVDMERLWLDEEGWDSDHVPFVGQADSSSAFSSLSSYCWPSCDEISSAHARSGYLLGGLALGGVTYALVNGGDDDNNTGSSGGSSDNNNNTSPPASSTPDSGSGSSFTSGTANMSCIKVSDPRNSFNFAVGNIQGPWNLSYQSGNFSININNANANLNGTHTGNNYNVSGTGIVAGFNTNITVSGVFDGQPGGQISANVTTGPLSTPDDFVGLFCQAKINF